MRGEADQQNVEVTGVHGNIVIVDGQGTPRVPASGDYVAPGEIILAMEDSSLTVQNGAGNSTVGSACVGCVVSSEPGRAPDVKTIALSETDLQIEALQQAIAEGVDPTQSFEAPAAGEQGGAGTSSFVEVLRTGEQLLAESGFDTEVSFSAPEPLDDNQTSSVTVETTPPGTEPPAVGITGVLTLTNTKAVEGSGTVTISASLDNPTDTALTINLSNGATITIAAGASSGVSTPFEIQGDDVYQDGESYEVSVSSTSGGNFENLDVSDTAAVSIGDTEDTTTLTLADVSVDEGSGTATISASLNNPTDTALIINLSNGATITIAAGASSGVSTPFEIQGDDVYQDSESYEIGVSSTSGGNFESLDTSDKARVTVGDTENTTTLTLADVSVDEGSGTATISASLDNPTDTALTINLSNGASISIAAGASSGVSTPFGIQGDDVYQDGESYEVSVSSTSGGNFESLDTSDRAAVTVSDTVQSVELRLSGDLLIQEGQSAGYLLVVDEAPETDLIIQITTAHITTEDGDIVPQMSEVIIAAGETRASFAVESLTDAESDSEEQFSVSIAGTRGGNYENLVLGNSQVVTTISEAENQNPVANSDSSSQPYTVNLGDRADNDRWDNDDSNGASVNIVARNGDSSVGDLFEGYDYNNSNSNVLGVSGSPRAGWNYSQIEYDHISGQSEAVELAFGGYLNDATFDISRLYSTESGGEQGRWTAYYNGEEVASGVFRNEGGNVGTFRINTGNFVFNSIAFEAIEYGSASGSNDDSDYYLTGFAGTGPGSANGEFVTTEGAQLVVANYADGLLGNDYDPDNHAFSLTAINGQPVTDGTTVTLASGAIITANSNGTFSFDPGSHFEHLHAGELSSESFDYTITDQYGAQDSATVAITVIGELKVHTSTAANDILSGGAGDDLFVWQGGDEGSVGSPAADSITDFDLADDKLDLSDLLQGENSGNLDQFLEFDIQSGDTVISVTPDGDGSGASQTITLQGLDLQSEFGLAGGPGLSADILSKLVTDGKLITD